MVVDAGPQISTLHLIGLVSSLLCVGTCNSIAYKVCYAVYGEKYAYFVSNGINALYVVFGGAILYPRQLRSHCQQKSDSSSDPIPKELRHQPQYKFVVMALLDSCGTFLSAMGSVRTPGYMQTILNQTLIPILMFTSSVALGTRFTAAQISGAALIVAGALLSSLESMLAPGSVMTSQDSMSVMFYLASNLPYALSAVYKEIAFKNQKTDVMYLTQQVSIYQFFIGLLMLPLTAVPGVASPDGMPISEATEDLVDGTRCYLELPGSGCVHRSTCLLLTGYCLLNFMYNTLGLYLTKFASSTVNAITSSLLLPVTALAFTLPVMGPFKEKIHRDAFYGLAVIVFGFVLYQAGTPGKSKGVEATPKILAPISRKVEEEEMKSLLGSSKGAKGGERLRASPAAPIPTFQERMVGIKVRHGLKPAGGAGGGGCIGVGAVSDWTGEGKRYGSLRDEEGFKGMRTTTR